MNRPILKLAALVAIAVLSILTGLVFLKPAVAVRLYGHTAYWFVLVTVIAFVWCAVRLWRRSPVKLNRGCILPALFILCSYGYLSFQEDNAFKIYADELALLGTSMQMHLHREAGMPMRAHDVDGLFTVLNTTIDKRPPLFPFLQSAVHDLSGYRPANAFILNESLTLILLILSFILGQRIAPKGGGYLAVLLWLTIPQLARSANGAGLGILNLVILLWLLLATIRYLEKPDIINQDMLVLSGVLCAFTRYESALFILGVIAVLLLSWKKDRKIAVTPILLLTPVFLIPILWQTQLNRVGNNIWQTDFVDNSSRVFSPDFFSENFGHAIVHFTDLSGNQPGSPLLALSGLIGAAFLILIALRKSSRGFPENPTLRALFYSLPLYLLLLLVILFFNLGQIDQLYTQRLALPLYLPLVFGTVFLYSRLALYPWLGRSLVILFIAYFFAWSVPVTTRHVYGINYMPEQGVAWARQYMPNLKDRDVIVISDSPLLWITHHIPSISISHANTRKHEIAQLLRYRPEKEILVFERMMRLPSSNELVRADLDAVSDDFTLEPVITHHINDRAFVRLRRITGVKSDSGEAELLPGSAYPALVLP